MLLDPDLICSHGGFCMHLTLSTAPAMLQVCLDLHPFAPLSLGG